MADTPNNDIEKRLRDYAQQRRDAAGTPEMHPATRAMLQAEVRQRLSGTGATTVSTQRAGWMRFWPRLAFALGVIAILGVAAILVIPPRNKAKENFTLAKMDEAKSASVASDKLEAAPAFAPAASPVPSAPAAPAARTVSAKSAEPVISASRANAVEESMRREVPAPRKDAPRSFKAAAEQNAPKGSAPASLAAASQPADAAQWADRTTTFDSNARPPTGSPAGISGVAPNQAGGGGGGGVAIMSKAAAPAMNKDSKLGSVMLAAKKVDEADKDFGATQARQAGEVQAGLTQRYRNMVVVEKSKQADQLPVLDEFTVAQNGEALTIVDRDGSVYNGYARLAPTERQAANYEASGAMQLVPNSYSGGRGGALFNQGTANRSLDDSRAQSQNLRVGQAVQAQSVGEQNATEPVNYFFRVEGTNRSLNQLVIVTGTLLQNGGVYNNAITVNVGGTQVFQQQASPANNASFNNFNNTLNAPMPNNFINGRVLLNNKQAGELNALSVDK